MRAVLRAVVAAGRPRIGPGIAATVLVSLLLEPANASLDAKNYPGMFCQPATGANNYNEASYTDDDHSIAYNQEYYRNASGDWQAVVCPVVSDCNAAYGGGHRIYVSSTHSWIECWIHRRDFSTGSGWYGSYTITTYNDGRREALTPTSLTTSYTYGSNWFLCRVPSGAYIYGYHFEENC